MSPAVHCRSAICFLAFFGPMAVVGMACAYPVYRRLSTKVHSIERRVDEVVLDIDTDNATRAFGQAMQRYFATRVRKQPIYLVKRNATEG